MRFICITLAVGLFVLAQSILADGLQDNDPKTVRRVPPLGVVVPGDVQDDLESRIAKIDILVEKLRETNDKRIESLLPDVEIFSRAVRTCLIHQEFFSDKEFDQARQLLDEGLRRAKLLSNPANDLDWTKQTGLVVRGFRSKIDNTPQPYGLVIPASPNRGRKRLDIWFHGRGERTSEVGFIHQRMHRAGEYTPKDTIVLHPYGRYSNAFKFAGEVDVLEALESTRQRYAVDPDRISVRGFSMGGAACWQFAVHYADRWFAANPGAGFSETPEFLRFFQKETLKPTRYEQKLWQLYDCNGYTINLLHCPTVAYSGELDIQKQAADVMQSALAKVGIDLVHIIGHQTAHSIHSDSKVEIEQRMAQLAKQGRDQLPLQVEFQTYTLKYNRMHWITVDSLEEHWVPTTVSAQLSHDRKTINVKTRNVAALTIDFPAGTFRDVRSEIDCRIDGIGLAPAKPASDRSFRLPMYKTESGWHVGAPKESLRKRHDLQGPIDDAFMDSFIFVKPTGTSENSRIDDWVRSELAHAVTHWRQQFRGDARVKLDTEINDDDIAGANLVLFGTPQTNRLLDKLQASLPIVWSEGKLVVGKDSFDAKLHAPIMIYPNPLNRNRYVVLNSGFTYREYAYLNNARQVPMLPDWAIVDVRPGATHQFPGKVVAANFFDENWQLKVPASEIRHSFFIAGPSFTGIIDEQGEEVWDSGRPGARDGFVLPNGNVLIAYGDEVKELTRERELVFQYKKSPENRELGTAQRLENGNTLITELGDHPRLLEVRPNGDIAIDCPLKPETDNAHMQTRMARKLPNGNYLAPHLLGFKVKEYKPNGDVVATFATDLESLGGRAAENWPFTAIRLADGNTLVTLTHGNKIVELDSSGNVVWKVTNDDLPGKPFSDPCGAQRLPSGNTVICSYASNEAIKVFEVTRDKEIVWTYEGPHRAHEIQILTTNGKPLSGPLMK